MIRTFAAGRRVKWRLANRASGGRLASGAMTETTQQGQGDDVALARWLHRPPFRAILRQRPVRAVLMIIAEVVPGPLAQVMLVEHDHMV